ncbi:MAG: TRAP transporter TatT component family protein [Deltaproteobacteria bacterium]|nr:TRAP transporter TatT component family protein [Deltaproteobacteria bacterium]
MQWRNFNTIAIAYLLLALSINTGCSGLIASAAADAVAGTGLAYASDDDPQLVRAAIPFGLKTIESLLEKSPNDPKLLLAAASGFTQYAYAFVQFDAERSIDNAPNVADKLFSRARKLYLRARHYGLRGLEAMHPGFTDEFAKDRKTALATLSKQDVPFIYWTAVAWAAQISISKDDLVLVADLTSVESLMNQALLLDESYNYGAIHEFYITYEGGRSEASGGSMVRAKKHFERTMQLCQDNKLSPLVTYAEVISVQTQNRQEFLALIEQVLSFDVNKDLRFRLNNVIAQERALWLKERVTDLFL